jgi:hypothetical protein
MQVVSITQNALVFDADDWGRLGALMTDFNKVCDSQSCKTCPLGDFCAANPNPADYLKYLYEFLDD